MHLDTNKYEDESDDGLIQAECGVCGASCRVDENDYPPLCERCLGDDAER